MYFVQKVDIFNKQIENWDDYFLSIAVGSLRSLCCSLQGCAVITKVAGRIHVVLFFMGKEGSRVINIFYV